MAQRGGQGAQVEVAIVAGHQAGATVDVKKRRVVAAASVDDISDGMRFARDWFADKLLEVIR
jgi:hypothetical protein